MSLIAMAVQAGGILDAPSARASGESVPAIPIVRSASAPRVVAAPVRGLVVPRTAGRVTAAQLGLVVNDADSYSVAVGAYYASRRGLPATRVLHVRLPMEARLSRADAAALRSRIDAFFGPTTQALALAWTKPYAVECQSITGVLALGFEPTLCAQTCTRSPRSPYFNAASSQPFRDYGWRPSMLLAARSVEQARQLIDRGLAADASLGLRGGMPVQAYFMVTDDAARNVRATQFPPAGVIRSRQVELRVEQGVVPGVLSGVSSALQAASEVRGGPHSDPTAVVLVHTGTAVLPPLGGIHWVPGALADHLTSFGGLLEADTAQSSALEWIAAGATASFGTVSEPCNHPEKFPSSQALLLHYVQGASAIEAYWKSVAWPHQGVFNWGPLGGPVFEAGSATLSAVCPQGRPLCTKVAKSGLQEVLRSGLAECFRPQSRA